MIPAQQAQRWSPEDDAEVLRLINEGKRCAQIAPHFPGRSYSSVESRYAVIRKRRNIVREVDEGEGTPGGYRRRMNELRLAAEAAAYERTRRADAERGCRLLKEAMDRYYANRLKQAA